MILKLSETVSSRGCEALSRGNPENPASSHGSPRVSASQPRDDAVLSLFMQRRWKIKKSLGFLMNFQLQGLLIFIFTQITGPLTERSSIKARGQAYLDYQKHTNFFFPGIKK